MKSKYKNLKSIALILSFILSIIVSIVIHYIILDAIEKDVFTLNARNQIFCLSIILLVFNVCSISFFENKEKPNSKKFTIEPKIVLSFIIILLFVSFTCVLPEISKFTIKKTERLSEVAFDGEKLKLFPVENAYRPFCTSNATNVTLSWYTIDCEDKKYLQSREIKSITPNKSDGIEIFIYEVHDDFRNFTIFESERPRKFRDNEIQSFVYSYFLILYNLAGSYILLFLYPYSKNNYKIIKIIWGAQNIILILLSTIMISEVFKF